jgi:hypothetical protein
MFQQQRFVFRGIWIGLALAAAGCGDGRPERVPVSGIVLIDGKPATTGHIQFVPRGNPWARGTIGPDGRFTLTTFEEGDGCVLGDHRVAVSCSKPSGSNAVLWLAPKEYSHEITSNLKQKITGPVENLKIELTWGKGKPFVERFETAGDSDPRKEIK